MPLPPQAVHEPPREGPDEPAKHPIRVAMEARDHAAVIATLAPGVVLRSPVTAVPIEGREAVSALLRALIEAIEELEYTLDVATPDVHVLGFRMVLGGRPVEGVDVLRFDEHGLIREIVVTARPMSATALFAAILGPPIASRRGRLNAALVTLITRPLPRVLAAGDRLVARVGLPRQA